MNKHVSKLKSDAAFMADCEKDLGRHAAINLITEGQEEIEEAVKPELSELLTVINTENERMLKHIMKVCFCSKAGAEHILDEIIDEIGEKKPDSYFIKLAGLEDLVTKAGFSLEESEQ